MNDKILPAVNDLLQPNESAEMNSYPEQCSCGGFYAHSSVCSKYQTAEELHKQYLEEEKKKEIKMKRLSGTFRIMEKHETPNPSTDFQLSNGQWMTPLSS